MERGKKSSTEVLDYGFDWDDEYLETGDTVSTSAWTVPTGITKDSDSNTTTATTIWLSGGTLGTSYVLVNTVVTAGGRTAVRAFTLTIVEYNE